jgi:hypothetical protein
VIVLVHAGVCDARMWDGFDRAGAFSHTEELLTRLEEPSTLVGPPSAA